MKHTLLLLLLSSITSFAQIKVVAGHDFLRENGMTLSQKIEGNQVLDDKIRRTVNVASEDRLKYGLERLMKENGLFLNDFGGTRSLSLEISFDEARNLNLATYSMTQYTFSKETHSSSIVSDTVLENDIGPQLIPVIQKFCTTYQQKIKEYKDPVVRLHYFIRNRNEEKTNDLEVLRATSRPDTLKKLALTNLKLIKIPKEVYKCKNLESIDLSDNVFTNIPRKLWTLKKMSNVNLSKNLLGDKSLKTRRNRSVKTLNVQFNAFKQMPKSLHRLKGIEDLYLGNNYLVNFHDQRLKKMNSLKRLNLYNAGLKSFPEKLSAFENLEELDVYYNNLTTLSSRIGEIKTLKTLAVANNNLWRLPSEIKELEHLETLYAHHNKLDRLPELPVTIKLLDIGSNYFTVFPKKIHMPFLEDLDISNNNLEAIPWEIRSFKTLKNIFMTNCTVPLTEVQMTELEKLKLSLVELGVEVR